MNGYSNRLLMNLPHNKVFMFHHVTDFPRVEKSSCKVSSEKFAGFFDGYRHVLNIDDFLEEIRDYSGKCAVTFDDGLVDVFDVAYPILKEKNIPFAVFVSSALVDTEGFVSSCQLRELSSDPLVTIGVHGMKHRSLEGLNDKELHEEIISSRNAIENIIGKRCYYFAYAYGQYNKHIIEMIKEAEYKAAFAVKGLVVNRFTCKNLYEIPRLSVDNCTVANY